MTSVVKNLPIPIVVGVIVTQQPETKLPWPPNTMRNRQRSHMVKTHDQRAHTTKKNQYAPSALPHAPRRIEHKKIREATDTTAH